MSVQKERERAASWKARGGQGAHWRSANALLRSDGETRAHPRRQLPLHLYARGIAHGDVANLPSSASVSRAHTSVDVVRATRLPLWPVGPPPRPPHN